jgi:protein required for attachment to host cells
MPITTPTGPTWYLLLNGSRGTVYARRDDRPGYDALRHWDAPDARTADHVLGEDRPGRAFASAGAGQRSGMENEGKDDSPKEHAKRDLMHLIAGEMAQALRAHQVATLVLVAPTPQLQALRHGLPAELHPAIRAEHAGDWTGLPTAEVFARLGSLRENAERA